MGLYVSRRKRIAVKDARKVSCETEMPTVPYQATHVDVTAIDLPI